MWQCKCPLTREYSVYGEIDLYLQGMEKKPVEKQILLIQIKGVNHGASL
jgi:hypothetical protein